MNPERHHHPPLDLLFSSHHFQNMLSSVWIVRGISKCHPKRFLTLLFREESSVWISFRELDVSQATFLYSGFLMLFIEFCMCMLKQ